MPNNFPSVGLIALILPNAKIIDARRHPLDACISCYRQLFAKGQAFTYDLTEIGEYYLQYQRMMDHWAEVLPGRVLTVQYEEVVADFETQVRRLLEFCGLPLEEACLRFYESDRPVRTPSSEQVRQPIYDRRSATGGTTSGNRRTDRSDRADPRSLPALRGEPPWNEQDGARRNGAGGR